VAAVRNRGPLHLGQGICIFDVRNVVHIIGLGLAVLFSVVLLEKGSFPKFDSELQSHMVTLIGGCRWGIESLD
jgi:hypothetical protein